jgi:hypothetical protein
MSSPSFRKVLALAVVVVACSEDTSKHARGRGLQVAQLSATDRARVYAAALGGAFDLGPGLSLLVDTSMLSRFSGERPGEPLGADVRGALHRSGVTKGECVPQRRAATRTPVCRADIPGYVVRFSDVFAMAGDSVQMHMFAERYDTPSTGEHNRFTLEQAYQLVRREGKWRVVRKARIE